MSAEENKVLVRRYVELIHRGDLEGGEALVASTFAFHMPGMSQPLDREGFRQLFIGLRAAFPDITVTNDALVAEGDLVAGRWLTRATHLGDFQGIPPTGRQVAITSMDLNRIVDGRIAERWHEFDALGSLQQLGVVPAPAEAAR